MSIEFKRALIETTWNFASKADFASYQEFVDNYRAIRIGYFGSDSFYLVVGTAYLEHMVRPSTPKAELHKLLQDVKTSHNYTRSLPSAKTFDRGLLIEKLERLAEFVDSDRYSIALSFLDSELETQLFNSCVLRLMRTIAANYAEQYRGVFTEAVCKEIVAGQAATPVVEQICAEALNVSLEVFEFQQEGISVRCSRPLKEGLYPRLCVLEADTYAVLYSKEIIELECCSIDPRVEFFGTAWTQAELSRFKASLYHEFTDPSQRYKALEESKTPVVSTPHIQPELHRKVLGIPEVLVESEEEDSYDPDSDVEPVQFPRSNETSQLADSLAGCILNCLLGLPPTQPPPNAVSSMMTEVSQVLETQLGTGVLSQLQAQLLQAIKDSSRVKASECFEESKCSGACVRCSGGLSTLCKLAPEFCNHLCLACIILAFKSVDQVCPACHRSFSHLLRIVSQLMKECVECKKPAARLGDFSYYGSICNSCARSQVR
jgi:hypothetical protein